MEKKEFIETLESQLKEFKDNLPNYAKAEDIDAKLKGIEEKMAEFGVKADLDELKSAIEEQGIALKKLSSIEKDEKTKGEFIAFVEKNLKDESPESKSYSVAMKLKAAALMSTANSTGAVLDPLFGNYIDSQIGNVPKADPVILPLVTVTNQPGVDAIYYTDRVNEDGDAAFIAEGTLKPLIDADYVTTKGDIKEVAERWKFTKRLVLHAPSIVSDFQAHANELIESKIDDGLISGTGTGAEISGIETLAGAFIVPPALANQYTAPNIYDVINACAARVRLGNFKGQITALINTEWKALMQSYKDTNNNYIVPPFVTPDGNSVGEVKVVFTNRVAATDITVGDLKKFNVVFAENVMFDEGYENDDFSKNLVSKKLEAFLGSYMKQSDAGSIIHDQIATIQTALLKP